MKKIALIILTVLLALGVGAAVASHGSDPAPNAVPERPLGIHLWGGYHWATESSDQKVAVTYTYTENTGLLTPYGPNGIRLPDAVLADWERYSEYKVYFVPAAPLDPVDMAITVDDFGMTGWAGLATVSLDMNNHITQVLVDINMYYYTGLYSQWFETALRSVFCQEVGHVIGLDHNRPGDASPMDETCMNDIDIFITPQTTMRPNIEDTRSLKKVYSHDDGYATFSGPTDLITGTPQKAPIRTVTEIVVAPEVL